MPAQRDPDAALVVFFKNHAVLNPSETAAKGRPIYDDVEACEIRIAGSRNSSVHPATEVCGWRDDPQTGEQTPLTYAERYNHQYRQFKMQDVQTKAGTPLTHVNFLTEARRAELRALNTYTVEALANVDGQELKNLGQGGRELKNKAMAYLEEAKLNAPNTAMQAELEALKARNALLEEDIERVKANEGKKRQITANEGKQRQTTANQDADAQFDDMSLDQLRDFITENTGHAPHGSLGRKTLVRMATEAQQKAA